MNLRLTLITEADKNAKPIAPNKAESRIIQVLHGEVKRSLDENVAVNGQHTQGVSVRHIGQKCQQMQMLCRYIPKI